MPTLRRPRPFRCWTISAEIEWAEYDACRDWYTRVKSRPSFRPILADRVRGITAGLTLRRSGFLMAGTENPGKAGQSFGVFWIAKARQAGFDAVAVARADSDLAGRRAPGGIRCPWPARDDGMDGPRPHSAARARARSGPLKGWGHPEQSVIMLGMKLRGRRTIRWRLLERRDRAGPNISVYARHSRLSRTSSRAG